MTQFPMFLCDTWWFAMSQRLNDEQFEAMARLRVEQGFTAVQLVVGIPPEVGLENPNAGISNGPAWDLEGNFNRQYLERATRRIRLLNALGLTVIVYGAWGHQIEWLGVPNMKQWWKLIVKSLDDLDVIYCLTGESDLWIWEEKKLLPDKSTGDLLTAKARNLLPSRITRLLIRSASTLRTGVLRYKNKDRKRKWSEVLAYLNSLTRKPIFVHVTITTSNEAVDNPQLLSAVTVQTGHGEGSRLSLHRLPHQLKAGDPKVRFVNLEPWYEGILDKFGAEDQLYAYWATMMAGADAYCYGAHGVWNVGDGKFLSHWGKQTLEQALELDTPRLLGISHKLFLESGFSAYPEVEVNEKDGRLVSIKRSSDNSQVTFYPDCSKTKIYFVPTSRIFDPIRGKFLTELPSIGQLVVIVD